MSSLPARAPVNRKEGSVELRVGLLGVGTVGGGVSELLLGEGASLKERTGGVNIRLVAAADIEKTRLAPLSAAGVDVTDDAMQVVARDDVDVIVELIGGTDAAKALILEALRRRRSVVTANKHLLAEHGDEIIRAARATNTALGFSAAVCGGVPVLLALRTGLVANKVASIVGIVNGTCNYILTRMSLAGATYAAALAEAQAHGYAEADPRLDVDGHDSAHKLAILAALAFRTPVSLSSVVCEGISGLAVLDLRFAQEMGYVVKLVAIGKRVGDRDALELRVHPTLLPRDHPLAAVSGVFNAVEITGHAVGRVMLFGRGAGKEPTASNIVADLVEVARGSAARVSDQLAFWVDRPPLSIVPSGEVSTRFYVRFTVRDEYGVLGRMARILGEHRVSIASVIQKEPHEGDSEKGVPIVMLTHEAREADFRAALDDIDACEVSIRRSVFLRIEEA
jgi:homoserine dehydrogenase